jgi:hypothetical protein
VGELVEPGEARLCATLRERLGIGRGGCEGWMSLPMTWAMHITMDFYDSVPVPGLPIIQAPAWLRRRFFPMRISVEIMNPAQEL